MTQNEKKESVQDGVQDGVQDKKETVKEAIIRAVPSVMDLKMGCEVKQRFMVKDSVIVLSEPDNNVEGERYVYTTHGATADKVYIEKRYERDNYITEIIGRPISLQDILAAIGNMLVIVDCMGNFYQMEMKLSDKLPKLGKHLGKYDLFQDFDHQSEEAYSFLYGLICD